MKCALGAGSRGNNAKLLLKKAGKFDGLVVSDQELTKLMKDRDEWRLRVLVYTTPQGYKGLLVDGVYPLELGSEYRGRYTRAEYLAQRAAHPNIQHY